MLNHDPEDPPVVPHEDLYRAEDFQNVQYKPLTHQQRNSRRLLIAAIIAAIVILLAFVREHFRV